MSGSDPEETMPLTHRPWGAKEPEQPWTSPSGTSAAPSGPTYVPPSVPPPPMATPAPHAYGPPPSTPWAGAPTPYGYGMPPPGLYGFAEHQGANSARNLAIISLVSVPVSFFCCITFVAVFAAPFAWANGAKALREIDANPGFYRNRSAATAAVTMGIIGTCLAALILVGAVALSALWVIPV